VPADQRRLDKGMEADKGKAGDDKNAGNEVDGDKKDEDHDNQHDGICVPDLNPGDYLFRVTGAAFPKNVT